MALSGSDGHQAERLLDRCQKAGAAVLGQIAESAVGRLLKAGNHARAKRLFTDAKRLFTDAERKTLANGLAATIGTANLLGRARIRLREQQAEQAHTQHSSGGADDLGDDGDVDLLSDQPTDFTCFDESAGGLHPMAPREAVAYFRGLVPKLAVDAVRFDASMQREAFTLAVATEETLLGKVKDAIDRHLAAGKGHTADIQDLLDEAGVSPRNPQYAEMVQRTNMMDAYNTGGFAELQAASDTFPVWRYSGIRDGRQGKDHEPHFDKYYPSSVTFAQVRGKRIFNCRCTFIAITKWEWKRLQAAGERVDDFAEQPNEADPERAPAIFIQVTHPDPDPKPGGDKLPFASADVYTRIATAARATNHEPSPAQKQAGNYRKGRLSWNGLTIVIETPAGAIRRGISADGTPWATRMQHHYGYIARTESDADGDPVDVFLGPDPESRQVFVVNQIDPETGAFDEHKCLLGFPDAEAAQEGYWAHYPPGWRGLGSLVPLPLGEFKAWLKHGNTGEPLEPMEAFAGR